MDNKNFAFQQIAKNLVDNSSRIQYGEISVSLKIHSGRIVNITHSLTENIKKEISDIDSKAKDDKQE